MQGYTTWFDRWTINKTEALKYIFENNQGHVLPQLLNGIKNVVNFVFAVKFFKSIYEN